MKEVDLEGLLGLLDPLRKGGRRNIDEIADAISSLCPLMEPVEALAVLIGTLEKGGAEGIWTVAKTTTVQRGRTRLPSSVVLAPAGLGPERMVRIESPLRWELAWAAELRLSPAQRDVVLAVNDWLRRTDGGEVPLAAAAERAYELLGDEKAFDSTPPRGGRTLWGKGRLDLALLRCERVPTPLTWEPVVPVLGPGPIICVENHATFRTMIRVLRACEEPRWIAVAWVQGRNTAPLDSLGELPFAVTRLDYLGDLDDAGLAIARVACTRAVALGIDAGPATALWELLIDQPSRPGRTPGNVEVEELVGWLPLSVRQAARNLLLSGRMIPQEALRFEVLTTVLGAAR